MIKQRKIEIYDRFGKKPMCSVTANYLREWAVKHIHDYSGWLVDCNKRREDHGTAWKLETVFAKQIAESLLEG